MFIFNKNSKEKLHEYLYNSNIHDSEIKEIIYDISQKSLCIKIYDVEFNNSIKFIFKNTNVVLSISGNEMGERTKINALVLTKKHSTIQSNYKIPNETINESLYLILETFAGDELHIIFDELLVQNTGDGSPC